MATNPIPLEHRSALLSVYRKGSPPLSFPPSLLAHGAARLSPLPVPAIHEHVDLSVHGEERGHYQGEMPPGAHENERVYVRSFGHCLMPRRAVAQFYGLTK